MISVIEYLQSTLYKSIQAKPLHSLCMFLSDYEFMLLSEEISLIVLWPRRSSTLKHQHSPLLLCLIFKIFIYHYAFTELLYVAQKFIWTAESMGKTAKLHIKMYNSIIVVHIMHEYSRVYNIRTVNALKIISPN